MVIEKGELICGNRVYVNNPLQCVAKTFLAGFSIHSHEQRVFSYSSYTSIALHAGTHISSRTHTIHLHAHAYTYNNNSISSFIYIHICRSIIIIIKQKFPQFISILKRPQTHASNPFSASPCSSSNIYHHSLCDQEFRKRLALLQLLTQCTCKKRKG